MLNLLVSLVLSLGLYSSYGIITNVDVNSDVYTIQDYCGNEWEIEGVEDWYEGDLCSMIMYNNGTRDITDDVVITVRYTGYAY